MYTYISLWTCDDINSRGGFPIKGSKSSTEIVSLAFCAVVPASSQKEAIKIFLVVLALEPPPRDMVNSKEEVGEAGRLSWDLAIEEVTVVSSLDGSFSLWRFLDRRPPIRPALAFSSWASTSFALLNLVIILEKEEGNDDPFFRKEKKRKKKSLVYLLFLTVSMFSNFVGRFWTKKVGK